MITVSIISILPESLEGILQCDYNRGCNILQPEELGQRFLGFGTGCFLYVLLGMAIDLLPGPTLTFPDNNAYLLDHENTMHDSNVNMSQADGTILTLPKDDIIETERERRTSAWNLAMLVFVSLLLHNAPEGFAVAASAVESHQLGIVVTIGIMLHNIPEGLAIAVPCIVAEPDRPWFAFAMATISGLAEPMGALVALQLLQMNSSAMALPMGNVLAAVAGIMCMVSVRDLYPAALNHVPISSQDDDNERDYSWLLVGSCLGTAIMGATEYLLIPR
jgi:ZIP family zinc transporter